MNQDTIQNISEMIDRMKDNLSKQGSDPEYHLFSVASDAEIIIKLIDEELDK